MEEDKLLLFSALLGFNPKTSDSSMKLGGFLLLVTLVTLSSVVQDLQAAVRPFRLFGESMQKAALSFLERRSQNVSQWRPVGAGEGGEEKREGKVFQARSHCRDPP